MLKMLRQLLQRTFCALQEYPRLKIIRKRPRESTDLEQYIILEPKNIIQFQKLEKLQLFENPCNVNFKWIPLSERR